MKVKILALLSLLFIVTTIFGQTPIPEVPNPNRLVNDYAGILSADQVAKLEQKLRAVDDSSGIQLAVVVMPELVDIDKAEFATQLGRKWGVGRKINSGIVLLISMDRKWFIAPGYGLEGELPDITCVELGQQYLVPGMREEKYYEAIDLTTSKILETVGIMPWQDRLKAREMKAAADKKDAEIREQKNQELVQMVLTVAGFIAILLLMIFLFYRCKNWFEERSRRKELKHMLDDKMNAVTKNKLAVQDQINDYIADESQHQWAKRRVEKLLLTLEEYFHGFEQMHDGLMEYTQKPIDTPLYRFEKSSYAHLLDRMNDYASGIEYIPGKIEETRQAVATEQRLKVVALQRLEEVKKSTEEVFHEYVAKGFFMDEFRRAGDNILQASEILLQQEAAFGDGFDEEVQKQANAFLDLQKKMHQHCSSFELLQQKLPGTSEAYKTLRNHVQQDAKVNQVFHRVKDKYPASVWQGLEKNWLQLIGMLDVMSQKLEKATDYATMKVQRFDDATNHLETIDNYIRQISGNQVTINELELRLEQAKKEFAAIINQLQTQSAFDDIKSTIYHADVSSSLQKQFQTMLTRIATNASVLQHEFDDWISHLANIQSLKSKFDALVKDAENMIASAEAERQRKKREKEEEQRRKKRQAEEEQERASRRQSESNNSYYKSSDNSTSRDSFSFGGGSFGGAGGGGTW